MDYWMRINSGDVIMGIELTNLVGIEGYIQKWEWKVLVGG